MVLQNQCLQKKVIVALVKVLSLIMMLPRRLRSMRTGTHKKCLLTATKALIFYTTLKLACIRVTKRQNVWHKSRMHFIVLPLQKPRLQYKTQLSPISKCKHICKIYVRNNLDDPSQKPLFVMQQSHNRI